MCHLMNTCSFVIHLLYASCHCTAEAGSVEIYIIIPFRLCSLFLDLIEQFQSWTLRQQHSSRRRMDSEQHIIET